MSSLPVEFVIARHGESERNAIERFDAGEECDIDLESYALARLRPDWQHRLSPAGENQAKQARKTIVQELGNLASRFESSLYASPYIRACETAAHMSGDEPAE